MKALHSALKTTVLNDHTAHGIHYKLIRLQNGKDNFTDTLHARPNTWSSSGIQSTDFLSLIGFRRSVCQFHHDECFCMEVTKDIDVAALANAIQKSLELFQNASSHLENCGLFVAQPEGWGFFYNKPANRRMPSSSHCRGNGHTASKIELTRQSPEVSFNDSWRMKRNLMISNN